MESTASKVISWISPFFSSSIYSMIGSTSLDSTALSPIYWISPFSSSSIYSMIGSTSSDSTALSPISWISASPSNSWFWIYDPSPKAGGASTLYDVFEISSLLLRSLTRSRSIARTFKISLATWLRASLFFIVRVLVSELQKKSETGQKTRYLISALCESLLIWENFGGYSILNLPFYLCFRAYN